MDRMKQKHEGDNCGTIVGGASERAESSET